MKKRKPPRITKMIFQVPPIFAVSERYNGNTIQQLVEPGYQGEVVVEPYAQHRVRGHVITPKDKKNKRILVIANMAQPPKEFKRVLRLRPGGMIQAGIGPIPPPMWIRHPRLTRQPKPPIDYKTRIKQVLDSWHGAFQYLREDPRRHRKGLRPPQAGAVHAVQAHWVVGKEAGMIVMPTGTGKTEVMLSVLVSERVEKLLVVVPTDVLWTQIADKFLTLGILKDIGVVSSEAFYPIVGVLKHKPKDTSAVDTFFEKCNVVVTTMNIAGQSTKEVQQRIAHHCQVLFIDEAHHIAAATWRKFKRKFDSRRILQFTATPFRNDDKPVGGKMVFDYPLRKAQEDKYFAPIHFKPVIEFHPAKADQAIAEKAIEELRKHPKNHVLMARVANIERARQVFSLYEQYTEFNPVQLHTGIQSVRERERIRKRIIDGKSRIIVCVDMLGEGFDLPELKIAAFHDIRKSLPVTLQLAGRFSRSKVGLGKATFIANIGDVRVREELRKLYSQDADWNHLLPDTSAAITREQVSLREFIDGFGDFPQEIPLENMRPAMSMVVYTTKCENWMPENYEEGIEGVESLEQLHAGINREKNTLVIVTARKVPLDWAQFEEIFNWDWELYILFWDRAQNSLFIHSSGNKGYYGKLAKAVAGDDAKIIRDEPMFRCFSGIDRLKLHNVGLGNKFRWPISYTMRAGPNVGPAISEPQKRTATKSVIFGVGYEDGSRTSVGCSARGRIWSHRVANLEALSKWCSSVGKKLLDETIDPEIALRGTLVPKTVSRRPAKMPIGIEWPEVLYQEPERLCTFVVSENINLPLYRTDIRLVDPSKSGDLRFEICSDTTSVQFVLSLFKQKRDKKYRFSAAGRRKVVIRRSGYPPVPLDEFFYHYPPNIRFADGSSLEGNTLWKLRTRCDPYPKEKILDWDWAGTNIRRESQGIAKESDTIQYRVIEQLKKGNYDIIFDDDGTGEAADVVSIRVVQQESIEVHFYHCKFSAEDTPGNRIEDLYTVCGQAQKSIHWVENLTDLYLHLLRREPKRQKDRQATRFERGNRNGLFNIKEMSRIIPSNLSIFIVQPGLSKAKTTRAQQELLSVTENYLMETYRLPFAVIASA